MCALNAVKQGETGFAPADTFEHAFHRYNAYRLDPENQSQQNLVPISFSQLDRLDDAMQAYVEEELEPSLNDNALNIVGFTASFCQVYGSIFAARHLMRISKKPMLFVFGGSSFSLPEGTRTLQAWGVDGLIVVGSGEAPLHALLEAALNLKNDDDPLTKLATQKITNLRPIGSPHKEVELSLDKGFMGALPDPGYDDYFTSLRGLCADEKAYKYSLERFVSLPVEGARGCFAKCDFCHNPNITSDFQSLTGIQVARRVERLVDRYGVPDITFVDSVSNTWAEGYADRLLAQGRKIHAFMELRVHAPEVFWTKLALSGATTLQLGVEAISGNLLRSMRKGTTVAQNIAATKFMSELGVHDASNLIIQHPHSTLTDIEETKRVMCLLEHLPIYHLSRFVVSYASPLYKELSEEKKNMLSRGFDWLDKNMTPFGWPRHLSYTWPNGWSDGAVVEGWIEFQDWYVAHIETLKERRVQPSFTVTRFDDSLVLEDTRFGTENTYRLDGLTARVFDVCHRPMKARHVAQALSLSEQKIQSVLDQLVEQKALILLDDTYLSIALRPTRELIQNYLDAEETAKSNTPPSLREPTANVYSM